VSVCDDRDAELEREEEDEVSWVGIESELELDDIDD
jgi:hypothetical protein